MSNNHLYIAPRRSGKTTYAVAVAEAAAKVGKQVVFYTQSPDTALPLLKHSHEQRGWVVRYPSGGTIMFMRTANQIDRGWPRDLTVFDDVVPHQLLSGFMLVMATEVCDFQFGGIVHIVREFDENS